MWRPVFMLNGFIMLVLGAMMLIPAFALLYYSGKIDYAFIQSGLIAIFFGGALFLANYGEIQKISILQGYLITICSWLIAPLVCAIPIWYHVGTWHDAVFEATAGITTAGSTIFTNVESLPKSILLWRAMLNGLGGIGIVIFAVALSPFLGTGGMHLFSKENSDTEEKFLPKIRYIANDIIIVYILLNVICAGLLKFFGMNWFDAVTWALSTVSTGGFSIKNDSISYYNSAAIESVIALFMLFGALPITYFILICKRKSIQSIIGNSQVNTFLKLILLYTFSLSLYVWLTGNKSFLQVISTISFNIIGAISTAGIYSSDYTGWGTWAIVFFFALFLHGGCTGSTTGSIKIFRWQVIAAFLKRHITTSLSPHQVTIMKAGDKVIDDKIVSSVFALFFAYLFAILFFTLILAFSGIDFISALGAVTGTISGVGTGLTPDVGPHGNFAHFSPFVKYILSFVMFIGRLEVITVVVLLGKIRLR